MAFIAILCVAYVVVTEALDWGHRLELIQTHWPRVAALLESRKLRLILLLVAIGLFVKVYIDGRPHPTIAPTLPQSGSIAPTTTGPATTFGDCSSATSGNGNKTNVDCGKTPDKATQPQKK
jgi:hypothetical protein